MIKNRLFLIPILIALVFSSFYVFFSPGQIKSDAAEYNELANSILKGEYSLKGKPSMEREPGYPLFRAFIKIFNKNETTILLIQILLYISTVLIVGITIKKIAPETGYFGLYGASLSYALAFYASTHISEILTAFLLAFLGFLIIKTTEINSTKNWILVSAVSGILVLTRYPYILVPIFSITVLVFHSYRKIGNRKLIKNCFVSFATIFLIISPWLVRNNLEFNEIGMAGRSGAGFYAKAWKAEKSWRSAGDSLISVFLGRGILYSVYPSNQSIWLDQWGDWWRNEKIVKEMWGDEPIEIDKNRKEAAKKIIFKDFNNFSRFAFWSIIDNLRFLQLQNPVINAHGSSFEGTYGQLVKEGEINKIQLFGLGFIHLIQIIWFVLVVISLYIGFKKFGIKFIPGIFFISILIVHSLADNIARYGAPLQPWLLSGIFITVIFPIWEKYKKWKKQLFQ